MRILEVGSGTPSKFHHQLESENILHFDISHKAFHVEVVGDAHCLPFKDNSFQTVYVSHVLEHLEAPVKAIKEFKRVTNNILILKIPNAGFYKWKNLASEHIYGWDQYTFRNLLDRYFDKVIINGSQRQIHRNFLVQFMMIVMRLFYGQEEFTAICYK